MLGLQLLHVGKMGPQEWLGVAAGELMSFTVLKNADPSQWII